MSNNSYCKITDHPQLCCTCDILCNGTDNATYKLTTEILNAMNNKLLVGGIFCDLEKATDCVN